MTGGAADFHLSKELELVIKRGLRKVQTKKPFFFFLIHNLCVFFSFV